MAIAMAIEHKLQIERSLHHDTNKQQTQKEHAQGKQINKATS